jgi:hypothetical protein
MKSKSVVTVYALNNGKADAVTCDVMLSGRDSAGQKWSQRYNYRGGRIDKAFTHEKYFSPSLLVPLPAIFYKSFLEFERIHVLKSEQSPRVTQ